MQRLPTLSIAIRVFQKICSTPKSELLLAVVETALQLIFNIFEWPQKALKLWVKIAQNILVQIGLKWLHINTFS